MTGSTTSRQLRSDAQHNRERILRAAAAAFGERGPGVSLVEIARRAGVGNATLHRNFTKDQLVDAVFAQWFTGRLCTARRALADTDPWHGFATFCDEMLAAEHDLRSMGALFVLRPEWRDQFVALMRQLLERAQLSGDVRADLTSEDLVLCLFGIASAQTVTAERAPHQWRRQLHVMLAGMRAGDTDRLPGYPVAPDELNLQLTRWSDHLLGGQPA